MQEALSNEGHHLRYNERAEQVEWREEIADGGTSRLTGWEQLSDIKEASLRDRIASKYTYQTARGPSPLRYGREAWEDAP